MQSIEEQSATRGYGNLYAYTIEEIKARSASFTFEMGRLSRNQTSSLPHRLHLQHPRTPPSPSSASPLALPAAEAAPPLTSGRIPLPPAPANPNSTIVVTAVVPQSAPPYAPPLPES
jgi:hypothetical protein